MKKNQLIVVILALCFGAASLAIYGCGSATTTNNNLSLSGALE